MIKINLNPEKEKKKKGFSFKFSFSEIELSNYIYVVIFVSPILISLIYNFILSNSIDSLSSEKSKLLQEKQKYQRIQAKIRNLNKEITQLKTVLKSLESRKLVFENLKGEKTIFLNMFSAISSSLPDGVWLNQINLSRNNSSFQGFSFRPEYISTFYENLSKNYNSVTFSSISKKSNRLNEYYTFKFSLSEFKLNKEGE